MRILHLLNTGSFSGAENLVCQIIKMFQNDDNVEMAYASLDGDIREILLEKKIRFYPFSRLDYFSLKRIIHQYRPDIIHAHDRWASCIAAWTVPHHVKVISHIHCKFDDMTHFTYKSFLYRLACNKINNIFWVSESAYKECFFINKIRNKSLVLRNILNKSELYEKCSKDSNNYNYDIVFLGRLTYQKNPQRLIKILGMVKNQINNIKVAIIGMGDLLEEIEELVNRNGLKDNIDLYGFLNNPYKILSDSKVMLMTSRTEGTPMSALEAMALGVPLVSTPTDGISDLVEEGKNGFLSDDDKILKDKLVYLLENKSVREKMSNLALKKFDELNNVENYLIQLKKYYF